MEAIVPHIECIGHVPFLVTAFTFLQFFIKGQNISLSLLRGQIEGRIINIGCRLGTLTEVLVIQLIPIIDKGCLANKVSHLEIYCDLGATIGCNSD